MPLGSNDRGEVKDVQVDKFALVVLHNSGTKYG